MLEKPEVEARALAFLREIPTGVLATVSTTGEPFSSTVYFTCADDFSLYFIISHHSDKFKNLTLNPLASMTIGTGPAYQEVIVRGKVEQVNDPHARESVLADIAKRVASPAKEWPIFSVDSLASGGTALFKLNPTNIKYLDLTTLSAGEEYANHIYQILP